MSEKNYDFEAARKASFKNRESIEKSEKCACFFCGKVFSPSEIEDWTDGGKTAICPFCDVDSVIGDGAGYPLTKELLDGLHKYSFG